MASDRCPVCNTELVEALYDGPKDVETELMKRTGTDAVINLICPECRPDRLDKPGKDQK